MRLMIGDTRGHMMRCHGDLPRGNYLCHETHYCVSSRDTQCATWHTKLRKWTVSSVCGVTYPGGVLPGVIWNGSWSIKSDKNTHTQMIFRPWQHLQESSVRREWWEKFDFLIQSLWSSAINNGQDAVWDDFCSRFRSFRVIVQLKYPDSFKVCSNNPLHNDCQNEKQ